MEGLRIVGSPGELARTYYASGADELLYIDTVASLYGRDGLCSIIREAAEEVFIPLTVGGGIRSLEDAHKIFRSGADKVALNSAALRSPTLIRQISDIYGSQATVLSIEAKQMPNNQWNAFFNGGREDSKRNVLDWLEQAVTLGVGEVLVTSVDRDGTGRGFDHKLISTIPLELGLPLVISGGARSERDVCDLLSNYSIDGVALGMALHKNMISLESLRANLIGAGMNLRNFP